MKIPIHYAIGAILALLAAQVRAATYTVLPGQSVQAAFDNATAGDTIIIKAGTYNEDLALSKNLDVRPESGALVTLTGNLTLNAIAGNFPLANFRLGSASNKTFAITNCPDVFLEDIDGGTGGIALNVTGSKVYAYSSSFKTAIFATSNWTMQECNTTGNLTSNGSDSRVLRCNIGDDFAHNTGGETNCTIFQSYINDHIHSKAKRTWIGYNTAKRMTISGLGAFEAEIVGNDFQRIDNSGNDWKIVNLDAANLTAQVRNNTIRRCWGTYTSYECDGLYVRSGVKIRIHNNIFHRIYRHGIVVHADTQACEIVGNFFTVIRDYAVNAPFDGVTCTDNWFWDNGQLNGFSTGGVVHQNTGSGDPKFVQYNNDANPGNNDYTLQGSSPLINAGSQDPEFKDHDGTRQDIGLYGGHHFDANGTTSQKPVVLSADLAPIRIQKGVTSSVKIKSRAALSTKK